MEKIRNKKIDFIIIVCAIAMGFVMLAIVLLTQKEGDMVTVEVSGESVASFPLSEELTYVINGKNGGTNTLLLP